MSGRDETTGTPLGLDLCLAFHAHKRVTINDDSFYLVRRKYKYSQGLETRRPAVGNTTEFLPPKLGTLEHVLHVHDDYTTAAVYVL